MPTDKAIKKTWNRILQLASDRKLTVERLRLMQAFLDGGEVQFRSCPGIWRVLTEPGWQFDTCTYRLKPEDCSGSSEGTGNSRQFAHYFTPKPEGVFPVSPVGVIWKKMEDRIEELEKRSTRRDISYADVHSRCSSIGRDLHGALDRTEELEKVTSAMNDRVNANQAFNNDQKYRIDCAVERILQLESELETLKDDLRNV